MENVRYRINIFKHLFSFISTTFGIVCCYIMSFVDSQQERTILHGPYFLYHCDNR